MPSAKSKVKLALCQLLTTDNKEANISTAQSAIKEAASNGADMVVLPEMWNCPYSNDSFPTFAEDIEGGTSQSAAAMAEAAKQHGVTLVAGSMPEKHAGNLYNTCLVFDCRGQQLARFRKMHLFDINIPGKITFRESDTLTAGENIAVVDTEAGRLGLGICYDIRFPELAMIYARQGVQLILYPGAFNMTTGPVHWELLAKARAVDNQLFVGVCSPARNMDASYHAWGHSMLVGPFGQVLATAEHEPGIIYADLDYAEVDERRKGMPLATQKREDLYELVDKTHKA
ncbi:hypothetical protein WJX84_012139 [Apatococcus fuscideae]|uniref:CN hydrolase domain-containing protein n=1 Tax=Apatococcus fuscideae TaxID=2026836 RepID=A0AAW1SQK6_9CHLO